MSKVVLPIVLLSTATLLSLKIGHKPVDMRNLHWKAGDVIACKFDQLFVRHTWINYWILAIDEFRYIHLTMENYSFSGKGQVIVDSRLNPVTNQKKCYNYGKRYKGSAENAVSTALSYENTEHKFHSVYCNWSHWVNKWTKGHGGFDPNVMMWAQSWCDAY